MLLYRQRPEAHLQTVHHRRQGGGPHQGHPVFPLEFIHQAGTGHRLGEKALQRQIQQPEIRGIGRCDIFIPDVLCLALEPDFKLFQGQGLSILVPVVPGLDQPLVILQREFCVDGQPHRGIPGAPGQPDGEFHPFLAAGFDGHIGAVLLRGQHVPQQVPQLHFAPDAPVLHIGQHLFQVAHTLGQGLHGPQGPVHHGQPVADHAHGQGHLLVQAVPQPVRIFPGLLVLQFLPFAQRLLELVQHDDQKNQGTEHCSQ